MENQESNKANKSEIKVDSNIKLLREKPQMEAGTASSISALMWFLAIVILFISIISDKVSFWVGLSIATSLIVVAIQVQFFRAIIVLLFQVLKAIESLIEKQK